MFHVCLGKTLKCCQRSGEPLCVLINKRGTATQNGKFSTLTNNIPPLSSDYSTMIVDNDLSHDGADKDKRK